VKPVAIGLQARLGIGKNGEKNGEFRGMTRYMSKTIADGHTIKD